MFILMINSKRDACENVKVKFYKFFSSRALLFSIFNRTVKKYIKKIEKNNNFVNPLLHLN